MSWKREVNSLFTDSFFRFLFGFTVIIASSFGVVIVVDSVWGEEANARTLSADAAQHDIAQ